MVAVIAAPFPAPPGPVGDVLDLFDLLRHGTPAQIKAAGDLTELARPWEPASCPAGLRAAVWEWCEQVAIWVNQEYGWRPAHLIPPCWPRHPHIARELPVLAVLRWQAQQAAGPEPTEEWHRYTFPMFAERMTTRLGDTTCRTAGRHQDWPAQGRAAAYTDPAATADRRLVLDADAGRALPGPDTEARRGRDDRRLV